MSWLRKAVNSVTKIRLDEIGSGFSFLGYRTKSGEAVSEQTALQVSAVFCAVRVIAEGMAQMPLRVMRKDGSHTVQEVGHWSHRLLTKRPNAWQSPYDFVENAVMIAALTGDFFALKIAPGTSRAELRPLPMGTCSVVQGEGSDPWEIKYRVSLKNGKFREYAASEIFHLRGPSLDNFSGIKPVMRGRESIGLSQALEKHQAQLAGNGGRPSGLLTTSAALKPDQKKSLKETWDEKYGVSGDGGIAVLDLDWKFIAMSMTSVDAQHLETRKHQIEEVGRIWRVFPQMLMQSDKTSTFASAQEFFRAHVVHTLGPWIERFEGAVNRDLLADQDDLYADFDEYNLMRGSFEEQAAFFTAALGASRPEAAWQTRNEIRQRNGLDPIEGGDTFPTSEGSASEQS